MSDRVHVYNKRLKLYGDTYANRCFLANIKDSLFEYIYFIPQNKLNLKEEDASDFVLYVMDNLDKVLASYRDEANDFYAYFSAVLDNKVRTFYRNRKLLEKKERSAYAAQIPFEFRQFPTDYSSRGFSVSDDSASVYGHSPFAKKLRFVALENKPMQKRLFVLLISMAPLLPLNLVEDVCALLEFNLPATVKLSKFLENFSDPLSDTLNQLCERRNFYFSKGLEIESEIFKCKSCQDLNNIESYVAKLGKMKKRMADKNSEIKEFPFHVNYYDLSRFLGISKNKVHSDIYYSKNLIIWCNDPSSIPALPKYLGIGVKLINEVINGRWQKKKLCASRNSIFNPMKEFEINFALNE